MASSDIVIRGAREHNLRDVSLVLPRGKLICLTGVSGSGKSSLAFDTLYAEGQRRYVESLSSYARQFLGQMPKPAVDRIDGLSPSISIQQKTGGRNPRSTVGTITEINDYLRVLFARVGQGHCPNCGRRGGRPDARTDRGADAGGSCRPGRRSWCWRRWFAARRGNTRTSSPNWLVPAMCGRGSTARSSTCPMTLSLDRQIKHHIEAVIDGSRLVTIRIPRSADGWPRRSSKPSSSARGQ